MNRFCQNCKNIVDFDDPDSLGCLGEKNLPEDEKPDCFDSPIKVISDKFYWHSSKESNWDQIDEIEEEHGPFFNSDDAKRDFTYTGYEVECDIEIHPDGRVFATHFMGKKLEEKVRI